MFDLILDLQVFFWSPNIEVRLGTSALLSSLHWQLAVFRCPLPILRSQWTAEHTSKREVLWEYGTTGIDLLGRTGLLVLWLFCCLIPNKMAESSESLQMMHIKRGLKEDTFFFGVVSPWFKTMLRTSLTPGRHSYTVSLFPGIVKILRYGTWYPQKQKQKIFLCHNKRQTCRWAKMLQLASLNVSEQTVPGPHLFLEVVFHPFFPLNIGE